MPIRSRVLSRILFLGGVLLLAEGSFSVLPFLFTPEREVEAGVFPASAASVRLRPGTYVFQISLPRQRATFRVVEGTTPQALRLGPGHLEGSAMPGDTGNSVIAGHRDTHFRVLKDVAVGDEIRIEKNGKHHLYRIVETRIVAPDDTRSLRPESEPMLTLVTCYPFYFIGPAPSRFVVRARALEP